MGKYELDPFASEVFEYLRKLGVKGVLFDKDDTLIYTDEIFVACLNDYARNVARRSGLDFEDFFNRLESVDTKYLKAGVSPAKWELVVKELAVEFPRFSEMILDELPTILRIYSTQPRLRPGAALVLRQLQQENFRVGIVTHANREWAEWKLEVTGLGDYIDAMIVADENGSKKVEHWAKGMKVLELEPKEAVVVGDNLTGDIIAGTSLGARGIWIPSPKSLFRQGNGIPEGVVTIENMDKFWDGVMKLR